jgi:hypothetical protein
MSDETVLLVPGSGQGTERRFHTTDCRYVQQRPERYNEWDRALAEAWDYQECSVCQQYGGES